MAIRSPSAYVNATMTAWGRWGRWGRECGPARRVRLGQHPVVGAAAVDDTRDDGDQDVDGGSQPQCRPCAVDLEQEERREHAPGDGAERVDGVERREVL